MPPSFGKSMEVPAEEPLRQAQDKPFKTIANLKEL